MTHRIWPAAVAAAVIAAILCCAPWARAQLLAPPEIPPPAGTAAPADSDVLSRLDRQEAELRALRQRVEEQDILLGQDFFQEGAGCGCGHELRRLPVVVEVPQEPSCGCPSDADVQVLRFYTGYDEGIFIRPFDPRRNPFALQVNGSIQFRHIGFDREADSWTDNAGVTREIRNRNSFEIERGRLIFSGYALSQRLKYYLQLDGDTDGGETVDFLDYWWAWETSDSFEIQFGKRKVPGVRQWQLSSRYTRLIDRPMACDFFRPDRTTGIFGVGRFGETGHFELMIGNGFSTANQEPDEEDTRFTFSATHYCDPWGDYGTLLTDYEDSDSPRLRIGQSVVFATQGDFVPGQPVGEADFIRLTDGTELAAPGALAPGVTVSRGKVYLYGVDFAWKSNGWSVNTEGFLRWIEDLAGDGPLPKTALFQRGFYVEGGRFIIPKRLDWNVRYSQVDRRLRQLVGVCCRAQLVSARHDEAQALDRRDAPRWQPRKQPQQQHPGRLRRHTLSNPDSVLLLILPQGSFPRPTPPLAERLVAHRAPRTGCATDGTWSRPISQRYGRPSALNIAPAAGTIERRAMSGQNGRLGSVRC